MSARVAFAASVAVGATATMVLGGIVLTVSWFQQNMTISKASEDSATQQFDEVHRRFLGQQPLIQLVDGRPQGRDRLGVNYGPRILNRNWGRRVGLEPRLGFLAVQIRLTGIHMGRYEFIIDRGDPIWD